MTTKYSIQFDPSRARRVADSLIEEWGIDAAVEPYHSALWQPQHADFPVLHLEDITGIPFVEGVTGVQEYQHRARVRANSGDLFAAGTQPAEGYEEYCRHTLDLGAPDFLYAADETNPMAVARACVSPEALDKLAGRAAEGGLVIHPYMSIESVWQLARRLSGLTEAPISVLGPPPPVLWVANDKAHCSRLVSDILGEQWLVDTRRSRQPAELAQVLGELSQVCPRVGIKRTRCASAMGNIVFDAAEIADLSHSKLRAIVDEFLERTEWCGDEDVLVVEWRETDLSPSTQVWIPPQSEGLPVLEGIYEQLLDGPEKVFLGSRPSTLPDAVHQALGRASLEVCTAFQRMGYVGRCSFDFIITGDPEGDFDARFTECNGRWGGTSTPMHLVDRLVDTDGLRPPYIATDYYLPDSLRGMTFPELIDLLGDDLYRADRGEGRFILYNVGPLQEVGKFDVISLGDTPEHARSGLDEVLPTRLGL